MPLLKNVEILYTLHNISHVIKLHITLQKYPIIENCKFFEHVRYSDTYIL